MRTFVAFAVVMSSLSVPALAAPDAAERAAAAAERAAAAAERSAAAAERAAAVLEGGKGGVVAAPVDNTPPVPVPVTPSPWTFNAGVGVISLTGNAQTVTVTANVAAQRKSEKWILALRANGAYGQSNPPASTTAPTVLALSALFGAQADYRFSQRISGFIGAGVDTDHVKSVEVRGFGDLGVGIQWIDNKDATSGLQRTYLSTDLGFRYQRENRFQYFPLPLELPDVDLVAPRAAATFRYALSKEVIFQQDLEVLPNILGPPRVLVNTLSKISARLISALSIGVSFAVKYDSAPALGRVPTDTALTVGLEAAL